MLRGLYTAWTGMRTEQKRLDVISNNVANAATTGYKGEGVTNQSFDDMLAVKIKDKSEMRDKVIGKMSLGVKIGEVYTNHTQGSVKQTGETYDLALDGEGFFEMSVTDKSGNSHTRYTRAGSFHITYDGYIVDSEGNHLQSEAGDLLVPTDAGEVYIDKDGSVYADGEMIDQIRIVDFEDYNYLKKFADTMYEPVDGAKTKDASALVMQGYLENSNINVVSEMVNMIAITRAYEAGQKVVQAYDSTMELAANSVGKV